MIEDFTLIFEPAQEGGFMAYIPEIPGAVSEGETLGEAKEMVLDAMREVLAFGMEESSGVIIHESEGSEAQKTA